MQGTAIEQAPKAAARLPMTPARRVALLFGVPLCLIFTAALAFNIVGDVGRGTIAVRYSVPAGASRVSVTTSGGDLVLRRATTGTGTLTGTGSYSLVRPDITQNLTAGTATFDYKCVIGFVNCGLNGTLSVPGGTTVSVSTDGGNVTATGTSGDIRLSTGGGNVTADHMGGDLAFSTGGGNIQASYVTAPHLTADTGGGDINITFTTVPRDVQVTTGGGNITIIVPPGDTHYQVNATSGGGSVKTYGLLTDSTSPYVITATTGGGDITIEPA